LYGVNERRAAVLREAEHEPNLALIFAAARSDRNRLSILRVRPGRKWQSVALEANGRPSVYSCALPLRLKKEWPFFPAFGDEERGSFLHLKGNIIFI
jgi:hypothetical protein